MTFCFYPSPHFSLMICNSPLLFCHSKNIRMSTLITITITYQLLIIIIIIITKSHNNYCSVGVMELCLLNVYIDWFFLCNSCPCVLFVALRACHMWWNRNHMFIREIWGKFTSFMFWNFEISLVSLERFQNLKKVNSVNLSQISFLNMWLLVQICCIFSERPFPRTPPDGCFCCIPTLTAKSILYFVWVKTKFNS